ncbi:hypothetical protein GCM10009716_19620 [Streptomyces sodiiphilus]|uniref:Uncharacterized protein n=1 Tax=Streptomyces sodiiphilus TaxID=226217 RepID=A0ABN2P5H9_9ACTN
MQELQDLLRSITHFGAGFMCASLGDSGIHDTPGGIFHAGRTRPGGAGHIPPCVFAVAAKVAYARKAEIP